MRIAFYAPLKPPTHPVPSGDRRVGRAFLQALSLAGHEVALASEFRSWEGAGDAVRQQEIEREGRRAAARLIEQYRSKPRTKPDLWLTYHVYHKAPDWLGPLVAEALDLPYVAAEASLASKQAQGPWAHGHAAATAAIVRADRVIQLNRDDLEGILRVILEPERLAFLAPFFDLAPYLEATPQRPFFRADYGIETSSPWLLSVAMMRPGAKLASYRVLADALRRLQETPWQLILAGDGPARGEVEALFADFPRNRVHLLGALDADSLPALYASADLYLWPAVHEAFGMALLEAQAAGLPVVAGRERGVPELVRDGETGLLTPPGDSAAFATAAATLLADAPRRKAMSRRAREIIPVAHGMAQAAMRLDDILRQALHAHRVGQCA